MDAAKGKSTSSNDPQRFDLLDQATFRFNDYREEYEEHLESFILQEDEMLSSLTAYMEAYSMNLLQKEKK